MTIKWLAQYFVHMITEKADPRGRQTQAAEIAIEELQQKGWTIEGIKEQLDRFKSVYADAAKNIYHVQEIMNHIQPPRNLMIPGAFYYHHILRKMPPAPKMIFDPVTKTFHQKVEKYYLEMKPYFSMDELLRYWYRGHRKPDKVNQDISRFNYLLKIYDLDVILFAIDIGRQYRKECGRGELTNVFEIEHYIEAAEKRIKEKRALSKLQGVNEIVRREG
jgi:hypothetical protein